MEIYKKADAWIISNLNDLYLWILDWTGVYIGTITFLIGAEQTAFWISRDHKFTAAFMLLMMLANSSIRYYQQAAGKIALYNAAAEWFDQSIIRHLLAGVGAGVILSDTIKLDGWSILDSCATQSLLYLWCLKIRERQKKDFKLPKLATQGSS